MNLNIQSKNGTISRWITSLDFVSPHFLLESNNSNKFKSVQGTVISLMILVSAFTICFFYGKEIYERKKPKIFIYKETKDLSQLYLSEVPIIFSFIESASAFNIDLDLISKYITLSLFSYSIDDNGVIRHDVYNTQLRYCNDDVELPSYLRSNKDRKLFCFSRPDNLFFANSFFERSSTNLNIGLKKCVGPNCPADLDLFISRLTVTVSYLTTSINLIQSVEPYYKSIDETTTLLDYSLFRRFYLRFTKSKLITDYGWFLEDLLTDYCLLLESVVPDDISYNEEGVNSQMIFMLSLISLGF